jgi:hypothetical protein
VGAASANYAGWTCCDDALFYTELLEAQLHELGLQSWPAAPEAYERLVEYPETAVARLWRSRTVAVAPFHAAGWPLHALVDFLTRNVDSMPIPDMQRLLVAGDELSYWNWLTRVTGGAFASESEFERALLQVAAERRLTVVPPVPLPDQDLQLVCRTLDGQQISLFRYDLSTRSLQHERELESISAPIVAGLPARDGIVVSSRVVGRSIQPAFIWRDGQALDISLDVNDRASLAPLPLDSNRDSLLLISSPPFNSGYANLYAALAMDGCAGRQQCAAQSLPGAPTWSPDRRRSLLAIGESTPLWPVQRPPILYLGNDQGIAETLIAAGSSPFWIDDDTFGYIAARERGRGQAVVTHDVLPGDTTGEVAVVAQAIPQSGTATGGITGSAISPAGSASALSEAAVLFTTDDLDMMAFQNPATGLFIDRVLPDPNAARLLIITARPLRPRAPSIVAAYDLTEHSMTTLFSFGDEPFHYRRLYGFSPDGRWLVVGAFRQPTASESEVVWDVYLHGIDESSTRDLHRRYSLVTDGAQPADWRIDWSADGRWLAVATNGYVRLIAPDEEYSVPLIFDNRACTAAVWINEE